MKIEISKDVLKAISKVVSYNFESEAEHYEECLEQGEDVSNHIYTFVVKIQDWMDSLKLREIKERR